MVTLRPLAMEPSKESSPCHVASLALSEYGNIVVFCGQGSNRVLCRYTINGKLLFKDNKLKDDVVDMFISEELLVTGGANGRLEIRALHRWGIFLFHSFVCLFV